MDDRKRCGKPNRHKPHWHRPDRDKPIDKWCDGRGTKS